MKKRTSADLANEKSLSKLMFKLLPIQVLLSLIVVLNGIISSLFASNFIDIKAMSAVGLYAPILMLLGSINLMLVSGSTILCGECMGKNQIQEMRGVFSLDMAATFFIALVFSIGIFLLGKFQLVGFFTHEKELRPAFSTYLIGQSIGVIPFLFGNQLSSFLSLENKMRRNIVSSAAFIVANLFFNFLFVQRMQMGVWGLSLASSLAAWVFFFVQAPCFLTNKSQFKFSAKNIHMKNLGQILKIGCPGALSNGCQTLRGLIVNRLLDIYVGAAGLSAFCAANSFMTLVWCVPAGMVAVSRMVMSVGIGEEDRTAVANVMRVMFKKFCLLNSIMAAVIILSAAPLASLFYKDVSSSVFMMTVWGFRLLPLSLVPGSILQHFVCYGQASGKSIFVQLISVLDGVVFVSLWTALLIPSVGMNSVYLANVLNGLCILAVILLHSIICNKGFPRNMEELMVMPDSFGAPESERLEMSVKGIDDVVNLSKKVQDFCIERRVDQRRAFLAGLSLEEMAGNVVSHGFNKDKKSHSLEVRAIHKDQDVILRVRDDCVLFDPMARLSSQVDGDVTKNIGIRMVCAMAKSVNWQSIFGLNVLTVKI